MGVRKGMEMGGTSRVQEDCDSKNKSVRMGNVVSVLVLGRRGKGHLGPRRRWKCNLYQYVLRVAR
jgi:hypothetical protein